MTNFKRDTADGMLRWRIAIHRTARENMARKAAEQLAQKDALIAQLEAELEELEQGNEQR